MDDERIMRFWKDFIYIMTILGWVGKFLVMNVFGKMLLIIMDW